MREALLRSAIYAAAFAGLYALAVLTPVGQLVDGASLGSFSFLRTEEWMPVYALRDPGALLLCICAAVAILVAGLRGRPAPAIRASVLVGATVVVNVLLDLVLVRPPLAESGYDYNTFPSGHAAVSVAAVVAVAWTRSEKTRPMYVAALSVGSFLVAVFSLLSFAHRASDIVAGLLLVGALAGLIRVVGFPKPSNTAPIPAPPRSRGIGITFALVLSAAVAILFVGVVYPQGATEWFVGMAMVLACAGLTLEIVSRAWRESRPSGIDDSGQ